MQFRLIMTVCKSSDCTRDPHASWKKYTDSHVSQILLVSVEGRGQLSIVYSLSLVCLVMREWDIHHAGGLALKVQPFTGTVARAHCRLYRAGIFKQSMGAWNPVGIGLSYRPARLHRWRNSFLGIDSWAP
jgi:hypothetical protein